MQDREEGQRVAGPGRRRKRARDLEEEEGCGQTVRGVDFMTSEGEQSQKTTKSRV